MMHDWQVDDRNKRIQLALQKQGAVQERVDLAELVTEINILRAECEVAKARRMPDLDALSEMQADETNEVFKRLAEYCRCRVILSVSLPVPKDFLAATKVRLESIYAALPPWAKFRGEE